MSRLSDALGVPEGKPFEFEGRVYVIKGNSRKIKSCGEFVNANHEEGLVGMLDNAAEIKLLPTRYKRKELELIDVYWVGSEPVPEWVPEMWPRLLPDSYCITMESTNDLKVYTAEEFESTFEAVE